MFGYKNHIDIDCTHKLIRTWDASTANAHDGARLLELISSQNTGSAYQLKKNEAFLERGMFKCNIQQRRILRRPLPEHIARANAKRLFRLLCRPRPLSAKSPAVKPVRATAKQLQAKAISTSVIVIGLAATIGGIVSIASGDSRQVFGLTG